MIESSDILDLTDGSSPDRSRNDDQNGLVAVLNSGHDDDPILLPGRQGASSVSTGIILQDIGEMTPTDELDANSVLDADYRDVKTGFEELCPVCGDRVSGYHYGLLTCESCKGFFKRTVQNKKVYSCVDNRSCQIDKSQRKRCPYCRFQKCLNVGMKLEAVRSDRMRGGRNKFGPMYKRDRALKQQAAKQVNVLHGSCDDLSLIANGMLEARSPGSPEDLKPDPHVLQANLNIYVSTALSNSAATSNNIQGHIPSSNCLSSTATTPSSSASIATSASQHASSSSPTPAHPRQMLHMNHQSPHQILVSISSSDLTQSFSHISSPSEPHSPKTYYSHHPRQQQQSHHILERVDSNTPTHHHQPQHIPHVQPLSDFHMAQDQPRNRTSQPRHNNNLLVSDRQGHVPNYPNGVEALRAFKGSMISGQPERSMLSPLINEIKATLVDESEVKHKMLTFMQNELSQMDIANPEQFLPVLCRMVDQLLFLMVEWARNSTFFKEIKVEDQMKLLHNSWSEILILDFIYRQCHNIWGKEIVMPNGEVIGFDFLDKLGLGDVKAKVYELVKKGRDLKLDYNEYMCLKFIILLNADVSSLDNRVYIERSQEKVTTALLEYCRLVYPNMGDKYSQLLMRLPEIRLISIRMEDFLYFKHLSNEVPDQTLLTEVLHAKRRG